MECNGKTALVTGAAGGVGRAIATRLAGESANVVLADITADGAHAAEALGERAAFIQVDITSGSDVRRMVEFAVQTFGGLDILVNNAGGGGLDPGAPEPRFPDVRYEQWSRTLDLNLRAPMLAIQCALEQMREGGAIVNIASIAGVGLSDYRAPEYGTAKAGLIRLTACLTHLKEERNVRVNCLAPDWIATERALQQLSRLSEEERRHRPAPIPLSVVCDQVMECIRDEDRAGSVTVIELDRSARRLSPA
ncbi:MAG TPA: SDR family oxidoreductase [Mycobacteriales bacterium]|nr:SDR family oxidoreductase [Mycobacteriales bacterium]